MVTVPADVAQLVERNLAKVEVAGSNPVVRSIGIPALRAGIFSLGPQWPVRVASGTAGGVVAVSMGTAVDR